MHGFDHVHALDPTDAPTPHDVLAFAGSAPVTVNAGMRFTVEWRLRNLAPDARAVNVYVRCPGVPIEGFTCRNGRTSIGRSHASAAITLGGGVETTLVALLAPLRRGPLIIRADAVCHEHTLVDAMEVDVGATGMR